MLSKPQSCCPVAVDPAKVGTYPALTKSGGGEFYDEVLEYRVWVHSDHGDDVLMPFPTFEDAFLYSRNTKMAEFPLVLVSQREWVDYGQTNCSLIHKTGRRVAEQPVSWLRGRKRTAGSIPDFLCRQQ